jgi:ubiquinone/menaquinone biosynthesis C-methylase UbiE
MALNKEKIVQLYRKRSNWYDFSANTYYLLGIREFAYRKMAIRELGLKPGDTVVEIGCGTGLNFPFLQQVVGHHGQILGVDMTPAMLAKADQRIRHNKWSNVSLFQCDAAKFEFPHPVDGIISTFALTLIPEYDKIIENGSQALSSGGRMVILDFKMPEKWPSWLVRLFVMLTRPFGVSLDLTDRHLWESIDRHLKTVVFKERYFGGIYISAGEAA